MSDLHDQVPGDRPGSHSWIHHLVAGSLAQPFLVIVAAIAVGAVGVWSFGRLPVEAYPDL